jgi:hypothetical protein
MSLGKAPAPQDMFRTSAELCDEQLADTSIGRGEANRAARGDGVVRQDIEQREDGVLRIAHRVAKDRVISTVDPEARHGHKTAARGFDGYKRHVAVDPEAEIITAAAATAANADDASVAEALLTDSVKSPAGEAKTAETDL